MHFVIGDARIYRVEADLGRIRFLSNLTPQRIMPLRRLSFGKCEMEDVAERLLGFSVNARQWVGVSFIDFALQHQHRLRDRIRKALPRFGFMARVPDFTPEKGNVPVIVSGRIGRMSEISTIRGFPLSILTGVKMLEAGGFLEIVRCDEEDVLVPTEALVFRALNQ